MKKFFKSFLAAFIAVIALAFAACGGIFEGNIGISDNDKTKTENAVRLLYETDDSIKNGYEMKCKIRAEKSADLNRDFIFALSSSDPIFSDSYTEYTLFMASGSDIAALKKDDGSYGDLQFIVKFDDLSKYFEETQEAKQVYFVFHSIGDEKKHIYLFLRFLQLHFRRKKTEAFVVNFYRRKSYRIIP